jgi:hypothetical protein
LGESVKRNLLLSAGLLILAGCAGRERLPDDAVSSSVPATVANSFQPEAPANPNRLFPREGGDMGFVVEKIARRAGCYPTETASRLAKRPGIQFYRVGCANGTQILLKCEMRQCHIEN